ncbi:MAG: hypothetical protein JWQ77_2293 [Jatrophihabitans sp.]|nr:hypothetical protein [Jatrophihabitans sp.]
MTALATPHVPALTTAIATVGPDFPAVGVALHLGWVIAA